jgi:hypothetical protein
MKRAIAQITGADHKISRRDYYQMFTSALMVILGVMILFRSWSGSIVIMPLLVGGGLLTLGCYRLNFVVKYFRERQKCNHR